MKEEGSKMRWAPSSLKAPPLNVYAKLATVLFATIFIVCSFDTARLENWKPRLRSGFDAPAAVVLAAAAPHSKRKLPPGENVLNSTPAHQQECPPLQVRAPAKIGDNARNNSAGFEWIRFPEQVKETETLLCRLAKNGSHPCHSQETARVELSGLPGGDPAVLRAGIIHTFVLKAYDRRGKQRCSGGDYFEADLSGPAWKSRPPVLDMGNGTYTVAVQVDPRFAGLYRLTVILLFGNFNGLHLRPDRWARREEMLSLDVRFTPEDSTPGPPLQRCGRQDFERSAWTGRWTRGAHSESCEINRKGRFECLDPVEPCTEPWCEGPLGSLESNGWVYSAHCSFKLFGADDAWECLDGKWLFFWGDSNHVDTIRNLLNFVLGLWEIKSVPRRFDRTFAGPGSKRVRITNVFNGHWNESMNYQGIYSLSDEGFREKLRSYFAGDRLPDFMIMNSGLHDGVYWKKTRFFARGAEMAAEFWDSVMASIDRRGKRRPVFLYRTTIATGGYARALWYNPYKMETYNHILVEKLRDKGLVSMAVDGFDLTFPWHYDNNCSDGVHYGRAPARAKWYGGVGHQYFVDLMLIHILLNAICAH